MNRRGITILEVLISIGVVLIGLLGVLAIVPVALRQVGQGQTADAVMRAGSNVVREFTSNGYARADVWRAVGNNGFVPVSSGRFPVAGVSYLLDPRFIAQADTSGSAQQLQADLNVRANFPYTFPTNPEIFRMPRITLRGLLGGVMSTVEADELFVQEDDLLFSIPAEVENPPEQVFVWSRGADDSWGTTADDDLDGDPDNSAERGWPGSDDVRLARESLGAFSWMATLVPKSYHAGQVDDRYQLSVVIFNRRDPALQWYSDTNDNGAFDVGEETDNERIAVIRAAEFLSDGIGGGEVVIRPYVPQDQSLARDTNFASLNLRSGDWVCLAGRLQNRIFPDRVESELTFRWYRVVSADTPDMDANNEPHIFATLEGPDWPVSSFETLDTQVIIVKDVVGVFERTIRIETSS